MKTLIIGAGVVGFNIADRLAPRDDVTVIEAQAAALDRITDQLDVRGLRGFGSQPNVLIRGGIESADMLVAATNSDEANMAACMNAAILGRSDIEDRAYTGAELLRRPNMANGRYPSI